MTPMVRCRYCNQMVPEQGHNHTTAEIEAHEERIKKEQARELLFGTGNRRERRKQAKLNRCNVE